MDLELKTESVFVLSKLFQDSNFITSTELNYLDSKI